MTTPPFPVEDLNQKQLERLVTQIWQKLRFDVTPRPRAPGILPTLAAQRHNGTTVEILCAIQIRPIHPAYVDQTLAAQRYWGSHESTLISTKLFSMEAIQRADALNCELIDGPQLQTIIRRQFPAARIARDRGATRALKKAK